MLTDFQHGKIDGPTLYSKTVQSLETAANTCIPKSKPKEARTHDIPHWRQRMSNFKSDVDYWLQQQFLCGGPRRAPNFILQQLRMAKARYKREHRALRREISANIADHITTQNCHQQLFAKPKRVIPKVNNGHSQPQLSRNHFKNVF